MYMQQSIVKCESGLYNRQATYFIQKANEFKSNIWVEVEDRKINAKSLLGVLSMGITKGTRISIIAEGPDEEEAVKALTEMLVKEIVFYSFFDICFYFINFFTKLIFYS